VNARLAAQRGFSVVEILVAMGLAIGIALVTLGVTHAFTRALGMRSTAQSGAIALEQQLDRMRSEAASAYAVFVPANDIFGKPNAAAHGAPGHEVDFYTKTDLGADTFWAYDFDAAHGTLERYDYDVSPKTGLPQDIGVADRATGAIDPGGYPAIEGVTAFTATSVFASELASQPNVFGRLLAGLVSAPGVSPPAEPVGFVPANGIPDADLYGGNTMVQVQAATQHGTRTLHLASGAMPSGFTIHDAPSIRAFTYRIDSIHRSWFGLAQKTWAHIFEQLQYNYKPADPASPWRAWCDYEVYGANSQGIALDDPNHTEDYQPYWWTEATVGAYYTTTHGGYAHLEPANVCSETIPGPNASAVPVPSQTSPDVIDTPPPCFTSSDPCWPSNAPPNWTPPSPWPSSSPPPWWCSTHELSQLCGGPGGTPPPAVDASIPPVEFSSPPGTDASQPGETGADASQPADTEPRPSGA
jgi:type II secretory pathway pseudopilin PulG